MKKLILTGLLALACEDMGQANNWDSSSPYTDAGSFVKPEDADVNTDTDTDTDTDTEEVDTGSDEMLEPDTDTTPKPEPECIYLQKKCITPPESRCIDDFTLMSFQFPVGHCVGGKCYYSWAKIDCFCVRDDIAGAHCEGEK